MAHIHPFLFCVAVAVAGPDALRASGTPPASAMPAPVVTSEAPASATRAAEAVPAPPYIPPEDPGEILRVDDEMRRFFNARVVHRLPDRDRLRALVEAILLPSGLNFSYDVEATQDARETFRRRRGNCVSFSVLFVAVARDAGFTAEFQNVETTDHWDRYGKIVASVQHVNVKIEAMDGTYVVDLRPDLVPNAIANQQRTVPDSRAFAQFYNTIGFFRLVHGDEAGALQLMVKATTVDERFAGGWANRASMHFRQGDTAQARACFERSIKLDPQGIIALDGYITVLRQLGTPDDLRTADKLDRRAARIRDRNPYYHQYLATLARERGDLPAAEKALRRAIALKKDEPDFYAQWIGVLETLGRTDDARRATEKLRKLRADIASASTHIVP